jgi:hypothetical protein
MGAAGKDGAVDPDASPIMIDGRTCFGTGLLNVCLSSLPTEAVTLSGSASPLDTGVDARCRQIVPQSGGPELCVIAGTTVTVSGTFVAIGTRPLVLVATDAVNVPGTLDVSSKLVGSRKGAGAGTGTCTTPGAGANDAGGGGGGAGGSFGTAGGKGGTGDLNTSDLPTGAGTGGLAGTAQAAPTMLRGGCSGARGGEGDVAGGAHPGGVAGDGGGAVYLIAGKTITIDGGVFASGAGGGANSASAGSEQGGGGGGAGGMIGLDAPTVKVSGRVAANGGGGGGGGGLGGGGVPGGDGSTTAWNQRAPAGPAADIGAGPGAAGTALGVTTNLDGGSNDGGGGGGAGGLGLVWVYGALQGNMISPAPVTH